MSIIFIWEDKKIKEIAGLKRLTIEECMKLDAQLYAENADHLLERPQNFDKMIKLARTLCQGFSHVRVDLYNVKGRIYFGEMTFTSLGGMMDFYTPEFLKLCGDKIDLTAVSTDGKWSMAALKKTNSAEVKNLNGGGV